MSIFNQHFSEPPLNMANKQLIEDRYAAFYAAFEKTLINLVEHFKTALSHLPIQITYKYRIKRFESLYRKLENRGTYYFDDPALFPLTSDFLAIRLVCPFLNDTELVEDFIENHYTILEMERKGVDFTFREFGYNSTHYQIPIPKIYLADELTAFPLCCEIQIRTILQDAWAEVEHELVYRSNFAPQDDFLRRKMAAVNANLTLADLIFQEIRLEQQSLKSSLITQQEKQALVLSQLLTHKHKEAFAHNDHNKGAQAVNSLLIKAHKNLNNEQYSQAIHLYTILLDRKDLGDQNRENILFHRGYAYFCLNKFEAAKNDFHLVKKALIYANTRYFLALCSLNEENYREALDNINEAINDSPEARYEFLTLRAWCAFYLNNLPLAIDDCQTALTLKNDYEAAKALMNLLKP